MNNKTTFGMYEVTLTSEQPGQWLHHPQAHYHQDGNFQLMYHTYHAHHTLSLTCAMSQGKMRVWLWPSTTTFSGPREVSPREQLPFSRWLLIWWRLRAVLATRVSLSCASEQTMLCTTHSCTEIEIISTESHSYTPFCYSFKYKTCSSWSTNETR